MTARSILRALFVVCVATAALAGCTTRPSGRYPRAFEDCYNRPPLYRQEHGCSQGH